LHEINISPHKLWPEAVNSIIAIFDFTPLATLQ